MAITFEEFRTAFQRNITTPQGHDYARLVHRWSPNEEGKPLLVVEPLLEKDVSWAIRYANLNNVEVAVVAGGHSFMGASSSNGGMQIDLRCVKQVYVENERFGADGILSVQGGASIGFFGWLLGGGAGWAMGKYGYAVDSALSARVALASGEVVTASLDENPNLFWALRGAGYNFGVVTSLKLRVEACPHRIFFALLAYQTSEFEALIAASAEYAKTQGGEDSLGIIYGTQDAFGGPGESMLLILYYHGHDEAEARRRFKPVMDIPHMPLRCGMEWLTAACDLVESTIPYTRRYADSTAMADMSFDALKPALRKCAPGTDKAEDEDEAIRLCKDIISEIHGKQEQILGLRDHRWGSVYPNGALLPGTEASYVFGDRYPRLQEVKAKYDPGNFFHKKHPIEPLKR
ncbi:FAD-binding domain-containing protein [Trematosphaeria pertusa]|uniref:FAD-binding domain-containing protein n=1 Tax=Trematosphaeria pertusa TaxID=390896 RepID=A0A6A6IG83_9PLEO|nr:FAD-binding domain-containing protein [Trematosphaeria pertusa]KAF2248550.1 FAD-binding domain-containing protein [Trematosphaeria pertusa]